MMTSRNIEHLTGIPRSQSGSTSLDTTLLSREKRYASTPGIFGGWGVYGPSISSAEPIRMELQLARELQIEIEAEVSRLNVPTASIGTAQQRQPSI